MSDNIEQYNDEQNNNGAKVVQQIGSTISTYAIVGTVIWLAIIAAIVFLIVFIINKISKKRNNSAFSYKY